MVCYLTLLDAPGGASEGDLISKPQGDREAVTGRGELTPKPGKGGGGGREGKKKEPYQDESLTNPVRC